MKKPCLAVVAPTARPGASRAYVGEEGPERSSLSCAADGTTIVFVRGGDHGANWPAGGNQQPNRR
jgi:hypothetical protein